jgi:hypothetical protein
MGRMARRALFALALAALAATLAACGGVTRTVDPVAGAATKTQGAGGYKATFSLAMSAGGRQLTLTGHGEFDADQGEVVMDMSQLLQQSGAPAGTDGTIDAIYLREDGDPVMYVKLGLLSSLMPGGKTWIRLDVARAGKAAGIDLGKLMGGATQNPADALQLLRANGDFTAVGTETVAGVSTTHYHGTVDLKKALAAKGAPDDLIQRLLDMGAPAHYPVDVWVDDSGYVRQLELDFMQTTNGVPLSTKTTIGMSDYGTNVSVSAPPADEVFDATELATKGLSSALSSGVH